MKRKYYLRGLGIGILVTALVLTFVGPKEMTDDEIIKRAEELGYVKADEEPEPTISLKGLLGTATPTPVPTVVVTPEPSVTEVPEATKAPKETLAPTETPTPEPTATEAPTLAPTATVIPTPSPTPVPTAVPTEPITPQPTEMPVPTNVPEGEVITASITVERGNTAKVVCNKIEVAGIVEDGEDLKNYIVRNQMADYINVGTYTLSSDMTYEEIVKILTDR